MSDRRTPCRSGQARRAAERSAERQPQDHSAFGNIDDSPRHHEDCKPDAERRQHRTAVLEREAGGNGNCRDDRCRDEALRGMTIWAAYAGFQEHDLGSLTAGKYADFVVLDRDIMTIPASDILRTRVLATYIGGTAVYQAMDR